MRIFAVFLLPLVALALPEPPATTTRTTPVRVRMIANSGSELVVRETDVEGTERPDAASLRLVVTGAALTDALRSQWRSGDLATATFTETPDAAGTVRRLSDLAPRTVREVRGEPSGWVLGFLLALAAALGFWQSRYVLGDDLQYSSSKFQMALWFSVVLSAYLASLAARGWAFGAVKIPENLMLLSGLSMITFGGAKAITAAKVARSPQGRVLANNPSVLDLVTDAAGHPDLGDLQMITVTVIGAIVYVAQLHLALPALEMRSIATLPDVDNTLLASLGLGHGAYLVKKAVGNVNQ